MELFDVNLEKLQDDYTAVLQEHMNNALATVAEVYANTKPLDLNPIAHYKSGNVPVEVLTQLFSDYPAMTVEVVFAQPGDQDYMMVAELVVTIWVLAQDTELIDSLTHRYALATATVLTQYMPRGVMQPRTPTIEVARTDVVEYAGFLKGAQITIQLELSANV